MWLELEDNIDTLKMFNFIFNKNIAYVPGTFFCVGEQGLNTMRLNFATLHSDVIQEKMKEFGCLIQEYLTK